MDQRKMSNWSLYILECKDGSLYTGITTNLSQRLKKHNEGGASSYTCRRRPVKVIYEEPVADESSARKREIEIKKLSRGNKLRLIKNFVPRPKPPAITYSREGLSKISSVPRRSS